MTTEIPREITIAAAMLINKAGEMLVVRKRGTTSFMQPGGKIDAGETAMQALRRELREEIALNLEPEDVTFRGIFREKAANEPNATVVAHVFSASLDTDVKPMAEIAEAIWLPLERADPDIELARLTEIHLLPIARQLAEAGNGATA